MPTFYLVSGLVVAAALAWSYYYGERGARGERGPRSNRLFYALILLLVWDAGRFLFWNWAQPEGNLSLLWAAVTQLPAWLLLLWGIGAPAPQLAGGTAVALVIAFLLPETAAPLFQWGFITALPLLLRLHQVTAATQPPPPLTGPTERPTLECIAEGVIVTNQQGFIEFVNESGARMLNSASNQLQGQSSTEILSLLPPISDQQSGHNQFELHGRMLQSEMNLIYDQEGAVQGTVTVMRDITAEYQAERAKNAFLTTISHELRTPLTAIKGYVELLFAGGAGPLNVSQKMFLETVQRNVTRIVQMINSLIFVSSARSGRLHASSGYTDLRQLIPQIGREMTAVAEQNQQKIHTEVAADLPPIEADPIHIATMLQELVSNGLKYNNSGGEVRLSASLYEENGEPEPFVIVSVEDNGIGIETDHQSHIFEDFYRPDQREGEVLAGGMGVGLSIVRALVEAYDGRIWFQSSPGVGSVFTFVLPAVQPPEVSQFNPLDEKDAV
jgi:signal transduction histidine kinase